MWTLLARRQLHDLFLRCFFDRQLAGDPTCRNYVDAIAHAQDLGQLGGDHDDAHPLLDEPTRGIDVGAKYEIYTIMNKLVAQGMSIVMISSELPEVLGMSDRIYVIAGGRTVGEMPIAEASQEKIMALATNY